MKVGIKKYAVVAKSSLNALGNAFNSSPKPILLIRTKSTKYTKYTILARAKKPNQKRVCVAKTIKSRFKTLTLSN